MTDILHEEHHSDARAAHDLTPPKALLDFMVQDWAPSDPKIELLANAPAFHARRRRLSERFPGEVLVVATGHEKVRANDTNYRFRPGTDFYYLTGNTEPDCVLMMVPADSGHRDVLFVEPNPGRTDATFFTDRQKGELWTGPRLGVPESRDRYRIDEALPISEFHDAFAKATEHAAGARILCGIDAQIDELAPSDDQRNQEFTEFLSEMRLLKDDAEIAELRKAMSSTKRAFEDVIRALPTSTTERHVEGIFNLRARVEGNDVGYNTIAASGANACILHWTKNNRSFKRNDLLLLDAGVEVETLYTADITRTVPISGRYNEAQEKIYSLVLAAQEAGFAQCKPGRDFLDPNTAAMRVLAEGLESLGILKSAQDALKDEHQFYKRYSLHNVSHMLGLDVHDCAAARAETYKYGKLEAGMVLTVEPGLYFQVNDLTVPERYRGIGVRIEDDVLI
ncbi:MAG: aminopeptidase P family protein, partial [Candidatus Eremiobacteraeota bacterium]|nr:aminopeptidase P family protein [Candidatus Eremiobacteraeota bacterium]